jgi:hypothetical protein
LDGIVTTRPQGGGGQRDGQQQAGYC